MLRMKERSGTARIALVAGVVLGLATPVIAGTVYSWKTEDGTISYADEKKKVPKMYRDSAKRHATGKLDGYDQFTESDKAVDGSYEDRLNARLESLRGAASAAATQPGQAVAPGSAPIYISTGGSRYGRDAVSVPVGRATAGSDEPIVIEEKRFRPADSNASRHVTVVKQGDRVISVSKDRLKQQSYSGVDATGEPESDAY
jgi:hypothetical protein